MKTQKADSYPTIQTIFISFLKGVVGLMVFRGWFGVVLGRWRCRVVRFRCNVSFGILDICHVSSVFAIDVVSHGLEPTIG